MAPPPNLLFVFADQMRGMDMGCAGNAQIHTPTLDGFAAKGVRLTHCYATTPVCGPNRATLLTGTFPTTHGVLGNDLPLPTTLPSLGTIAREYGYRTGYIGKWHLDGLPRDRFTPPGPRRFGFDFWAAYNCSHDYFHPRYFRDDSTVIELSGYEPDVQTNLALEFLDEQNGQQPFCLVLSWGPPHDPYSAVSDDFRAQYAPESLTLRPNVQEDAPNPLARGLTCRRTIADYYAAITALDTQFARLLHHLDALGLTENTIVVFTSDHGDMLWSHGWMKKQSPFEESVSVPFLIRQPGVLDGGRVDNLLLGTVDILPTLAGLLGWRLPAGMDGENLAPALLANLDAFRPDALLLAHYLAGDEAATQGMPEWRALHTHRHTYVETVGTGDGDGSTGGVPWLLFDNVADPFQQVNLAGNHEMITPFQVRLAERLQTTGDSFSEGRAMLAERGLAAAWEERERLMRPAR